MALDVATVSGEPAGVGFSTLGTAGPGTTQGKERGADLDVAGESSSTRQEVSDLSDSSGGEDDMLQKVTDAGSAYKRSHVDRYEDTWSLLRMYAQNTEDTYVWTCGR